MPEQLEDRPKLLGEKKAREQRLKQLHNGHVARLTDYVEKLRDCMGPEASIPYFDPWDGGVKAEVLFLLEAPGPKAKSSGFVSRNNPDETAKNLFELTKKAGIDRTRSVIWNAVPWYICNGSRIRAAKPTDISKGRDPLKQLLGLLSNLRAVVLLGKKAQKNEPHIKELNPSLRIFSCPHPSPMFVNRSLGNQEIILKELKTVSAFLNSQDGPEGMR